HHLGKFGDHFRGIVGLGVDQVVQIVQRVEQKMRVDLGFKEIQLRREFFIFHFLLAGLELEPIHSESEHTYKNHDEQRYRNRLYNKKAGIKVHFTVGVTVHEVPGQYHPHRNDDRERNDKFKKVTHHVLAFEKPGQQVKVVQVGDHPCKHKLHGNEYDGMLPIGLFTEALTVVDLVQKERQVHAPEKEVQQENAILLYVRVHGIFCKVLQAKGLKLPRQADR